MKRIHQVVRMGSSQWEPLWIFVVAWGGMHFLFFGEHRNQQAFTSYALWQ